VRKVRSVDARRENRPIGTNVPCFSDSLRVLLALSMILSASQMAAAGGPRFAAATRISEALKDRGTGETILFFDANAFADVRVPVRIYRAEQDQVLSSAFHAERVRSALPIEPEYEVVPGAPHDAFLDPTVVKNRVSTRLREDGKEFDHIAFHRRLNVEMVEFFDRTLPAGTDRMTLDCQRR